MGTFMTYVHSIHVEQDGWTCVDYGPMHLHLLASKGGRSDPGILREAAELAMLGLDQVAGLKEMLKLPHVQINEETNDEIAGKMIGSVRAIGDRDLTPMAAVAGTLADLAADWLQARGMTRVIVDNGGDIAVRLSPGETVRIGVRPDLRFQSISHIALLDSRFASWGVTTSGFGGRSFTRGIASAVTVAAQSASIADAASTAIANACFVEDERVRQMEADKLDPNTDLIGIPVTVDVGDLEPEKYAQAIERAYSKAEALAEKGTIFGALIVAGGLASMTEKMQSIMVQ
jgi:hypothetical protein